MEKRCFYISDFREQTNPSSVSHEWPFPFYSLFSPFSPNAARYFIDSSGRTSAQTDAERGAFPLGWQWSLVPHHLIYSTWDIRRNRSSVIRAENARVFAHGKDRSQGWAPARRGAARALAHEPASSSSFKTRKGESWAKHPGRARGFSYLKVNSCGWTITATFLPLIFLRQFRRYVMTRRMRDSRRKEEKERERTISKWYRTLPPSIKRC